MKKHSHTFKQIKRDNRIFTRHQLKTLTPRSKIVFVAIAFACFCFLVICYLSAPAIAFKTATYLKLEDWNAELAFSGSTIRSRYFEDAKIDFADDLLQEELDALNDGEPFTVHAQILTFLDDNAVMNYAQDDPLQIILFAETLAQQWQIVCNKTLPDLLSFIIFDEALAIVYQGRLWTSKGYFQKAAQAIDRQNLIWQEEKTNEQMRPDREEEQYYYDELDNNKYYFDENNELQLFSENEAIRRDQDEAEARIRAD